ncbi:MAG: hypothetical protein IPO40_24855 [Fibrobacteres bacterium]|nr:hypothetical protein [Fibrobacterota bacterium]
MPAKRPSTTPKNVRWTDAQKDAIEAATEATGASSSAAYIIDAAHSKARRDLRKAGK